MKQVNNTNYLNTVLALTAENQLSAMQDNVFDSNAGLMLLKEKSKVNYSLNGYEILVNVNLSKNSGAKAYGAFDTFDTTPNKGAVTPYLRMANYAAPISIDDESIEINAGEEKIIDVMEFFMTQANDTLEDIVNGHLYGDGTADSGKALTGLGAMVEQSASPGAYMNVTDSTYWVNQYQTASQAKVISGLRALSLDCSDGKDKSDLIIASREFIDQYEAANESTSGVSIAYRDGKLADAGFATIAYKGIPIVQDNSIEDYDTAGKGLAYMLNSKYLGFELNNMKFTEFVRPTNQLSMVSYLKFRAQLVTNRRNRQGVIVLS